MAVFPFCSSSSDVTGTRCALDVQPFLMELLAFLQQQVIQVQAVTHLCSWILVVFADQDDDLMESAKVLVTLYLHQRRWDISCNLEEIDVWVCDFPLL